MTTTNTTPSLPLSAEQLDKLEELARAWTMESWCTNLQLQNGVVAWEARDFIAAFSPNVAAALIAQARTTQQAPSGLSVAHAELTDKLGRFAAENTSLRLENDDLRAQISAARHVGKHLFDAVSEQATASRGEALTGALIHAAEKHAEAYDGDDRDCIKTDVINAFYAGSAWQDARASHGAQAPDDQRAAFEAWHRSKFATKHSTGQPTRDMHNGIYAEKYGPEKQQLMWEAWLASAALANRASSAPDVVAWANPSDIESDTHIDCWAHKTAHYSLPLYRHPASIKGFELVDCGTCGCQVTLPVEYAVNPVSASSAKAEPATCGNSHQSPYESAQQSSSGIGELVVAAATPASDTRAAVPDGWKLVPLEPTIEMIAAMQFKGDIDIAIGHAQFCKEAAEDYAAMLAAAPTAAIAEADAKDAARYRWLRDQARSVDWSHKWMNNAFSTHCRTSASQMDRVIDASMSATQQAQNSAKGDEDAN